MARKVFQDFAHVLCQRFIESPSNKDLVNLALFSDGRLELDLTGNKATHNRYPVSPLPYAEDALRWLAKQMEAQAIPSDQLVSATLVIDYRVECQRRTGPYPTVKFEFECVSTIRSPDRAYESKMQAVKEWGLIEVC